MQYEARDVSVVIPVRNRHEFITKAVESVLSQRPPPLEVVVVDDGSEDGSGHAAERLDPSVRVIRQSHQGRSVARNTGIAAAVGDLVAFLDSDDLWLPDKLARQLEMLERSSDPVAVTGYARFVTATGAVNRRLTERQRELMDLTKANRFGLADVALRPAMFPSSLLMPRSVLETTGGFDPAMEPLEDWDLMIRIARIRGFVGVPWPPVIDYRIHAGNTDGMQIARAAIAVANKQLVSNEGTTRHAKAAFELVKSRSARALTIQSMARLAALGAFRYDPRLALANDGLRYLLGSLLPSAFARRIQSVRDRSLHEPFELSR